MIEITRKIVLDERELEERFIRSGGPGGQNVNKLATAVQLRFKIDASPTLTDPVRRRLKLLAGRRVNRAGELVIIAQRFRTQEANRRDALERLVDLVRRAAEPVKVRRPTAPTRGSRERRHEAKLVRGRLKRQRQAVSGPEE